mgnify:CR=1 FL=1
MQCIHCQTETSNPKYCSRSCSAKYTNTHFPKRKLTQTYCKHCGANLNRKNTNDQRTVCDDCKPNINDTKTLGDLIYHNHHKSSAFALVRSRARSILNRERITKECIICKYNLHVEVCHIKAISLYSLDTLVSEINNLNNLVYLCPNHHWEFDNKLLEL